MSTERWPFDHEGLGMASHPLTEQEFRALPTEADQIAAMARSLRAQLLQGRVGTPITRGEAADIVELIELLATAVSGPPAEA